MKNRLRRLAGATSAVCALAIALAAGAGPAAAQEFLGINEHVVYTETNDTANTVLAFRRDAEGNLTPVRGSPFSTRGKGVFLPANNFGQLGPFDSDQNVVVDREHFLLFAVNSGSNSIAVFHILPFDGSLIPVEGSPFPSGGVNPVSIGVRGDQVVILNQNQDPAQTVPNATPTIVTRHIGFDGGLVALRDDTTIALPQGVSPSQALVANAAPFVFDPEFAPNLNVAGAGFLASYQLAHDGTLRANTPVSVPTLLNNPSANPLGAWVNPAARELYVGLVKLSEVAVFSWDDAGEPIFQTTVPLQGKAVCWVRTNHAGTKLYTSDTGSKQVDVLDLTDPAAPTQQSVTAPLADLQGAATFQLEVDPTDRFVYVISQRSSAGGSGNGLHVLAADADGNLTEVPSSPTPLPTVNPLARPQGVAIF